MFQHLIFHGMRRMPTPTCKRFAVGKFALLVGALVLFLSPPASHAQDTTPPALDGTTALVNSDSANPDYANAGDSLVLTFSVTEALSAVPTVTIAGRDATVTRTDSDPSTEYNYRATLLVGSATPQGIVSYNIGVLSDTATPANTFDPPEVTSGITVDRSAPLLLNRQIVASTPADRPINPDSPNDGTYASFNDTVTVRFEVNETLDSAPRVDIAGHAPVVSTLVTPPASPGQIEYIAEIAVNASTTEGSVTFDIGVLIDNAGNTFDPPELTSDPTAPPEVTPGLGDGITGHVLVDTTDPVGPVLILGGSNLYKLISGYQASTQVDENGNPATDPLTGDIIEPHRITYDFTTSEVIEPPRITHRFVYIRTVGTATFNTVLVVASCLAERDLTVTDPTAGTNPLSADPDAITWRAACPIGFNVDDAGVRTPLTLFVPTTDPPARQDYSFGDTDALTQTDPLLPSRGEITDLAGNSGTVGTVQLTSPTSPVFQAILSGLSRVRVDVGVTNVDGQPIDTDPAGEISNDPEKIYVADNLTPAFNTAVDYMLQSSESDTCDATTDFTGATTEGFRRATRPDNGMWICFRGRHPGWVPGYARRQIQVGEQPRVSIDINITDENDNPIDFDGESMTKTYTAIPTPGPDAPDPVDVTWTHVVLDDATLPCNADRFTGTPTAGNVYTASNIADSGKVICFRAVTSGINAGYESVVINIGVPVRISISITDGSASAGGDIIARTYTATPTPGGAALTHVVLSGANPRCDAGTDFSAPRTGDAYTADDISDNGQTICFRGEETGFRPGFASQVMDVGRVPTAVVDGVPIALIHQSEVLAFSVSTAIGARMTNEPWVCPQRGITASLDGRSGADLISPDWLAGLFSDADGLSLQEIAAQSQLEYCEAQVGGHRSFWFRGDMGRFDGETDEGLSYDGDYAGYHAGVDHRYDDGTLLGFAASRHASVIDYATAGLISPHLGEGELDTRLHSVTPYARWEYEDGGHTWGLLSFAYGKVALSRPQTSDGSVSSESKAALEMRTLGAGFDYALTDWCSWESDVHYIRVKSGEIEDIGRISDVSWRLRSGFDWRTHQAASEGHFTHELKLAARVDGGDHQTRLTSHSYGYGADLGLSTYYVGENGWFADMQARGLVAHSVDNLDEWSVGLSVGRKVANNRGLGFALTPAWGATSGGAASLAGAFGDDDDAFRVNDSLRVEPGVALRANYGFDLSGVNALAKSFGEMIRKPNDRQSLRLGAEVGFQPLDMKFYLQREQTNGQPTDVVMLEGRIDF